MSYRIDVFRQDVAMYQRLAARPGVPSVEARYYMGMAERAQVQADKRPVPKKRKSEYSHTDQDSPDTQ